MNVSEQQRCDRSDRLGIRPPHVRDIDIDLDPVAIGILDVDASRDRVIGHHDLDPERIKMRLCSTEFIGRVADPKRDMGQTRALRRRLLRVRGPIAEIAKS